MIKATPASERHHEHCRQEKAKRGYSLQKLLRILAALSLSLSKVVGQNASLPILFVSLLTGAPSLSAHPQTLSKPFLLPDFVLSQDGRRVATLCISTQCSRSARLAVRLRSKWNIVKVEGPAHDIARNNVRPEKPRKRDNDVCCRLGGKNPEGAAVLECSMAGEMIDQPHISTLIRQ
jgi:hypothetical protein